MIGVSDSAPLYALIVVGCVGQKVWSKDPSAVPLQPAAMAYASPLFRKSRAYAERRGDSWVILSAKYGFLQPGEMIQDYNETFNRKSLGLVDAVTLKWQVAEMGLDRYATVVVLAGCKYAMRVRQAFEGTGVTIEDPMQGLTLGKRLRWLNNQAPKGHTET
jgi:hypothetical protein